MKALIGIIVSLLALCGAAAAQHDEAIRARREAPWTAETLAMAERLPVQDGGRVKPLSTFAGFTLLRLNGKRSIETPGGEKLTPTAWLLDTLFFPFQAADYRCFRVENDEVIAAMGLRLADKRKRDRYSLNELQPGLERLDALARQYHKIEEAQRTSVQQQIVILYSNVDTFINLAQQLDFTHIEVPVGGHPKLAELFGGRTEVTFGELVPLAGELRQLAEGQDQELADAAMQMLRIGGSLSFAASTLAVVPPVETVEKELDWYAPGDLFHAVYDGKQVAPAHLEALRGFEALADARTDPQAFENAMGVFLDRTKELASARGEYAKVPLEVRYYKAKLIRNSLYCFGLAFLAMTFLWLRPRNRIAYGVTGGLAFAGLASLVGAILMRCIIRGRPPVSTLYETLIFVTAVGCLTALLLEAMNRRRVALSASVLLGLIGLLLANGYELLDKQDTMPSLVAVLDTNFWLATHVTAITSGYAAGLLAALLANIYIFSKLFRVRRQDRVYYSSLSRMVYGVLAFAVIFSTVGTILGGIWANDSWGRFWGWDPKENGALLIVLSQLAILHGRMGGYLREHGICVAAAFAGMIVAFSWFGLNLLGVGLHSYGFTSGIHTALMTYYIFQFSTGSLGIGLWFVERARKRASARQPAAPSAQPAPTGLAAPAAHPAPAAHAAPAALRKKMNEGTQPA